MKTIQYLISEAGFFVSSCTALLYKSWEFLHDSFQLFLSGFGLVFQQLYKCTVFKWNQNKQKRGSSHKENEDGKSSSSTIVWDHNSWSQATVSLRPRLITIKFNILISIGKRIKSTFMELVEGSNKIISENCSISHSISKSINSSQINLWKSLCHCI